MSDKNKKTEQNKEKFFSKMKERDIRKARKTTTFFMYVSLLFMFIITLFSLTLAFVSSMKPTPVIAFDSEGKRAIFRGEETIQDETSKVRIYRFLKEFINKYEGVSPNIDEDLTDAYNMLTPNFRQILLDKGANKEKIEMWKNKNFQTDFELMKIKFLKGSLQVGSKLVVEGIGKMSFRNAIDYEEEGSQREDFVYFNAVLRVVPVSLKISPDGLFVDIYKGKTLGDFRNLRAYLLEQKKGYLIEDEKELFQ